MIMLTNREFGFKKGFREPESRSFPLWLKDAESFSKTFGKEKVLCYRKGSGSIQHSVIQKTVTLWFV